MLLHIPQFEFDALLYRNSYQKGSCSLNITSAELRRGAPEILVRNTFNLGVKFEVLEEP